MMTWGNLLECIYMNTAQHAKHAKKKTILLVEDDAFVSDVYSARFKEEDVCFVLASDGREAMKKLKEDTPDVVLLDIMMPYMDGMEVLEMMKKSDDWKDIPVLMLTNLSEKENIERAMKLGADDYIIKSHFTPSEVSDRVRVLLEKKS